MRSAPALAVRESADGREGAGQKLRESVTEAQRIIYEPDVDGRRQYPRGFGFLCGSVETLLARFEAARATDECVRCICCKRCCGACDCTGGPQTEPECTCYEMTGGHQPGCYFNRTGRPGLTDRGGR
jgi:hypothetical protein